MLFAGASSWWNLRHGENTFLLIDRTRQVLGQLHPLLVGILALPIGPRGFALSGGEAMLPHRQPKGRVSDRSFPALGPLVAGTVVHRDFCRRLPLDGTRTGRPIRDFDRGYASRNDPRTPTAIGAALKMPPAADRVAGEQCGARSSVVKRVDAGVFTSAVSQRGSSGPFSTNRRPPRILTQIRPPEPPAPSFPSTMARILVIDDDDLLRGVIVTTLTQAGHTVYPASDGREGSDLFHAAPTDLVLTDIIMPGREGIETIVQLRQEHPHLPIVAMSGGSTNSKFYLNIASRLGASCILAKPFSPDELLSVIASVLAAGPPGAPPSSP